MVKSLSDESQHDGIGRWFDDDEDAVQSPQQIHTEEEQEAQKQPLDVNAPKKIIEWVNNRNEVATWRLLNAVINVPAVSSVPSLDQSEETMSFSTRSVHQATESDPARETGTWPTVITEIRLEYDRPNQTLDEGSDSSSNISRRTSAATPNISPSPSTFATSPSTHGYELDGSVVSMDDDVVDSLQYSTTHYPFVESPRPYETDQQTSYSEDEYDNDETSENYTRGDKSPHLETDTGCETTNGTDVLQHKDQQNKRGAEDDGNDHRVSARSKRPKKNEQSNLRLACPFYKFDPVRYRRCHSHVLKRNSYVKQHLFRTHMQPIHCDICLSTWPNDEKLREHRRAQQCEKREYIAPDGITPEQERKLRSRLGSQNKSESDQWFELYAILFPYSQKPKSAYLDGELSED
ncbi:hypothetical protein ACLX1H_003112 [Fusarium chlamydosporum]